MAKGDFDVQKEVKKAVDDMMKKGGMAKEIDQFISKNKISLDNANEITALKKQMKDLADDVKILMSLHHGGNRFAKVEVRVDDLKKELEALKKKVK